MDRFPIAGRTRFWDVRIHPAVVATHYGIPDMGSFTSTVGNDWGGPSASLRVLSLPNVWVDFDVSISIFRECLELEQCYRLDTASGATSPLRAPSVISRLRLLILTFRVLHGFLWDVFNAPNLIHLGISTLWDDDPHAWHSSSFVNFCQRSRFSLFTSVLRFDCSYMVDGIIYLMKQSPSLKGIDLRWVPEGRDLSPEIEQFFDALTFHPGWSSNFLPHASHFYADETLSSVRMLLSRCFPINALAEVQLYSDTDRPALAVTRMGRALKSTGVNATRHVRTYITGDSDSRMWKL
ncbi:hypothetical protein C8R45DRAFT_572307 [Mycena sanguinolenta]|nr:hypothetical protein C8R45DRAFT_572307 [Mycena sanguinolenta]